MDEPALGNGSSRMLDLDALRAYVAMADLGGLARAGQRIGRTEAAISLQMKRLEQRAGQVLFKRRGRRLVMTEAGEVLLGYARRMMALNDEALQAMQGADVAGQVHFGCSQDFGEAWLPPVLAQFRRGIPSLSLEVRIDGGTRSVQAVEAGELDLALALGLGERGHCLRVGYLPLVWIAHRGFEWDRTTPLPLTVFTAPCRFRDKAAAALDAAGIAWNVSLTSPSLYGVWTAVQAGLGVTIRTPEGLRPELEIVNERLGLPDLGTVDVTLYLKPGPQSPAVRTFTELLAEKLGERIAELDAGRAAAARRRPRASRSGRAPAHAGQAAVS